MAENSSIEWTDHTWNPWIGCTKISPGCDNCYAATQDKFRKWTPAGWGGERRRTSYANWRKPLQWQANAAAFQAEHGRRQRVFCASLADVFDNQVPDQWRRDLFQLIAETPDLDWLLLTKRIGNAHRMLPPDWVAAPPAREVPRMPDNVWIGATITSQAEADRDIPKLLDVPARVRFLSMEPLLGPVDLNYTRQRIQAQRSQLARAINGEKWLDWVIVGGESGPGARPMHPEWTQGLRDQCASAGVPFLFKQWGEWGPDWEGAETCQACGRTKFDAINSHGECGHCGIDVWIPANKPLDKLRRVGKKAAGRLLDGVEHNGFPGSA